MRAMRVRTRKRVHPQCLPHARRPVDRVPRATHASAICSSSCRRRRLPTRARGTRLWRQRKAAATVCGTPGRLRAMRSPGRTTPPKGTVMKLAALALPLVAAALVAACDERPPSPPTDIPSNVASPAPGPTPVPTAAPSAAPDPTPRAAAGANAADAATAQDSKANNPTGVLTTEEESSAMPKAGQANNHSSPSLEPGKP